MLAGEHESVIYIRAPGIADSTCLGTVDSSFFLKHVNLALSGSQTAHMTIVVVVCFESLGHGDVSLDFLEAHTTIKRFTCGFSKPPDTRVPSLMVKSVEYL